MRNELRFTMMFTMMLAVTLASVPSLADPLHSGPRPEFTTSEEAVIHRNSSLERLAQRDPWVVRRALDAIARADNEGSRESSDRSQMKRKYERPPNPEANPDLDTLSRVSPEAAHDLFQLIKKASTGRKSN
jgi:hypothetical protein